MNGTYWRGNSIIRLLVQSNVTKTSSKQLVTNRGTFYQLDNLGTHLFLRAYCEISEGDGIGLGKLQEGHFLTP